MNLLRGLLLDNLGLKLVALLLALVVYLHVYTDRPASMILSFPLEIDDLADTLSLSGAVPSAIQAELRGTGKQLIRLRLTEPHLKVSLAGVGPGRFERAVSAEDVPVVREDHLEVERLVSPRMLSLDIEKKLTRRIPVAPRIDEAQVSRMRLRLVADPAEVLVTGPRKAVSALDSLELQPVRVDGRHDTLRVEAKPKHLPPWCVAEPPSIKLTVVLERPRH